MKSDKDFLALASIVLFEVIIEMASHLQSEVISMDTILPA